MKAVSISELLGRWKPR